MKSFFIILFFLLSVNYQYAQWQPLNNFPDDKNLNSVYFTDDQHGWIAGEQGIILKFNPQDYQWERQSSPVTNDLNSIGFFSNTVGIAAGADGTIIRSEDGGFTWYKLNLSYTNKINELFLLDSFTAFAAGSSGLLLKSSDRGLNWIIISTPVNSDLTSVFFVSNDLGFAGTGYTSDEDSTFILRTSDGGLNWSRYYLELYPARNVNAIYFIDSLTGYLGGGRGEQKGLPVLFKTTNGGFTWNNIPVQYEIHDIKFHSPGNGIIAGGEQTYNKFLALCTDDTIKNLVYHNEDFDINSVCITPSGSGWAVGGGGEILFSDNYYRDWKHIYSGNPSWNKPHTIDIAADKSQYIGLEWGNFRDPAPMVMNRYKGTLLFRDISTYFDPSNYEHIPHKISMLDSVNGYYISIYGNLFKTTTGGYTWDQLDFGLQVINPGIFFIDSSSGWAYRNEIYKTADGGKTWQLQFGPSGLYITDLFFTNEHIGYACGSDENFNGKILKSTNGGYSWMFINTPEVLNHLTAISFTNPDTGIVVGWGNTRLITYNGGQSWMAETSAKPPVESQFIYNKKPRILTDSRIIYSKEKSGVLKQLRVLTENNYTDVAFSKNFIFITSDAGEVLISKDYGNSWQSEVIGSPVLEVDTDGIETALLLTDGNVFLRSFDNSVPVELVNFSAQIVNNAVHLEWTTSTEANNSGFDLERKMGDNWDKIAFVEGKGTTSEASHYQYTDYSKLIPGNIFYRLKQIDLSGSYKYSAEVSVNQFVSRFYLEQNYPNPFNPKTRIKYQIPVKETVKITLTDALGREVAVLENSTKDAGIYEITLNSEEYSLSSGVYFYTLKTGNYNSSKKLIIIK